MKKSGWRLAVSALLFIGWIGYLAYLAATTTQPVVLSRPQFLAADLYVVAALTSDPAATAKPAEEIVVKQFNWSANPDDAKKTKLRVKDLGDVNEDHGWHGPGDYILALTRLKENSELFDLTPLPRTPGFTGGAGRIYKATPTTLRQLELLTKEYHPSR